MVEKPEQIIKQKADEPVAVKKTGCNFCSHCRKKIRDGMTLVKGVFKS